MSRFWNEATVDRLTQLADGSRSAAEIAKLLGCTANAVIGKIHRAGGMCGVLSNDPGGSRLRRVDRTEQVSKPVVPPRPASVRKAATPAPRAGAASSPAAPAPSLIVPSKPMRFLDAIDQGRCLWFAGAVKDPSGPDMPVCGAERTDAVLEGRYCARHHAAQMREKVA